MLYAQNRPWCATSEHLRQTLADHPALAESFERQREELLQFQEQASKRGRALITVPVVVHVVHDGDTIGGDENISDAQIISQIDALNRDFRNLNPYLPSIPAVFRNLSADFEIEFCLAKRDPQGNPSNGINRIKTTRNTWNVSQIEQFKPSTIWNRNQYLNIWVMRLGGTDAGTLGYAQFPGLAESTDGIVIDFKAFGTTGNVHPTYSNGKTTTHEVGHWFGLYHIWGDDGGACTMDDGVSDTPLQASENFGCPTFPSISCGNGPNGDMFMNYMDYSDDACSGMFTAGQKAVADFTLATSRLSILSSPGCAPTTVNERDIAITKLIFPTAQICTDDFSPVIEARNHGSAIITSLLVNYQVNGGMLNQFYWDCQITTYAYEYITLPRLNLPPGSHSISIFLSSINGGADQFPGNENIAISFTIAGTGVGSPVPVEENFESGFLPVSWQAQNPNFDRTWQHTSAAGANGRSSSVFMDNFSGMASMVRGRRDGLLTDEYDFNGANIPYITFSVAYARRNNTSKDSLIVYSSLDCGSSWTKIWEKSGEQLATAPDMNVSFVPDMSQWREELIWVNLLSGHSKVKFMFENVSDFGNNLYLDDFKVNLTPAALHDHAASNGISLDVYPNPTDGNFNLAVALMRASGFELEIYHASGKLVEKKYFDDAREWIGNYALSYMPDGLYVIRVRSGGISRYRKVLVQR